MTTLIPFYARQGALVVAVVLVANVAALAATVGEPFDISAHPDWFYVDHIFSHIPYKSQEDSEAWTKHINATYGQRWRYHKKIRYGTFKCMSFAASTSSEWWQVELGRKEPFPPYRNFGHGYWETGEQPRALEAQYFHRREQGEDHFHFFPQALWSDPLTREPVAMDPEGYCNLLVNPLPPRTYADPLLGASFAVYEGKDDYGMDGEYIELFDANVLGGYDKNTRLLKQALHRHGVVLAGLETHVPVGLSIHAVCIVGYGEIEGRTYFVYRESFGVPGESEPQTTEPAYRMARSIRFNEAYCFPHRLRYDLTPAPEAGAYLLSVRNSKERPVDVDEIDVTVSLAAATLECEHVSVGTYLLRPAGVAEDTSWEATIRFNKRYHYPASGLDYEIGAEFIGTTLRNDLRRRQFRQLHGFAE